MNAAEALHSVLTRVIQSGATTVLAGWEQVLETDASIPEFALRHAEVVRLVELIGRRLYAAEESDLLVTTLTHLPSWYRAVVWRGSWTNTGEPAAGIIAVTDLNYLQLFATNGKYNDDTRVPNDELEKLRTNLDGWGELLDYSPDIPEGLKRQIRSQVEHIKWLIDSIKWFGPTPVVRETQALLGQVTSAGGAQPSRFAPKKRWAAALAGVLIFLSGTEQASSSVAGIARDARTIVSNVHELYDEISRWDQPALPAGSNGPPALPAGASDPAH